MNLKLKAAFLKVFAHFGIIALLVLVCVGIIGNIMTVIVFCNSKLKSIPPFQYLTFLAIMDSFILLTMLLNSLTEGTDVPSDVTGIVPLVLYLQIAQIASLSSAWLMLAFSYNRYISLKYPFRAKSRWILKNTKCIIFVIILVSCGVILTQFMFDYYTRFGDINILIYFLKFVIPFPIVIYLNIATYFMLSKHKKTTKNVLFRITGNNPNKYNVTKMLWVSSTMSLFLVPNELCYGLWILNVNNFIDFDIYESMKQWWYQLFDILTSVAYCGDFFVYCFSGKLFRSSLIEVASQIVDKIWT